MRKKTFYDNKNGFEYKCIKKNLYDFDVKISPKLWIVDSNPGKWKGIESFGKVYNLILIY